MFNITGFIMDTLKEMKGHYPDFQIKEYALGWYAKSKLTEENLAELEEYLSPEEVEVAETEVSEIETTEAEVSAEE